MNFEELLQEFIEDKGRTFSTMITEARGLCDGFDEIIKQFINKLQTEKLQPISNKRYSVSLREVDLGGDCFLNKPNINLFLTISDKTRILNCEFVGKNTKLERNGQNNFQLSNATFNIGLSNTTTEIDWNEFTQSMWHELLHAYREYRLRIEAFDGNVAYPPSALKTDSSYSKIVKLYNYFDEQCQQDSSYKLLKDMIYVLYIENQEEIDANAQMIFPYIERHTEINFRNYKEYLSEFVLHRHIQKMKRMIPLLKEYYDDVDSPSKRNLCFILNNIFDGNLTNDETLKRTIFRLERSVAYAEKKFYKVLMFSLEKLNRMFDSNYRNGQTTNEIIERFLSKNKIT